MTTRGPLTVRLSTPDTQQAFDVRDLSFSKSWRGGFKDASVTLSAPLNFRHPMLSPFAKMRIDDNRTARTVWEGYLDLPGKSRGDDGDVWQIGAVGPLARLSDRQRPYIVVDRDLQRWRRATENISAINSARAEASTHPSDDTLEALVLQFNPGTPVDTGSLAIIQYDAINEAQQLLGGFGYTVQSGQDHVGYNTQSRVGPSFTTIAAHNQDQTTTPTGRVARWDSQWAGSDKDVVAFRIMRDGVATNVTGDTNWSAFYNVRVVAKLFDQNGAGLIRNELYQNGEVLAHEIVTDALQHFFGIGAEVPGVIDIAGATIDQTFTFLNTQFAYDQPVTFQQVLEDLALFEPDMAWGVHEANSAQKHRFKLFRVHDGNAPANGAQPGSRYRASSVDGWDQPGAEADLRNSITVFWEGRQGVRRSKTYTASTFGIEVPELDQWGIIREGEPIDLSAELGSDDNADRIAEQYLRLASMPPESGTLTITQPVTDMWTGRDVWPWEIEPGYRILIQDVDIDPLPITEISYRDSDASAILTVGEPVLSTDEIVNIFAKRKLRRG